MTLIRNERGRMRRTRFIFPAAMVFLLALPAGALPASAQYQTGNSLYEYCDRGAETFFEGVCAGYIIGVIDSATSGACLPQKVPIRQLIDVVHKYLQDAPRERHFVGALLVSLALMEAFPC